MSVNALGKIMCSFFCFIGFLLIFFASHEFIAFVQFVLPSFCAVRPLLHANRERCQVLVVVTGSIMRQKSRGQSGCSLNS
jgi:hypothetical protein